jgi:hypothetical protein
VAQDVPPGFTWWNTTLTDSGHHAAARLGHRPRVAAGRRRRLGTWLGPGRGAGLLDDTVVLLTADHGMQAAGPRPAPATGTRPRGGAGIPFRDEAHGFLYLG